MPGGSLSVKTTSEKPQGNRRAGPTQPHGQCWLPALASAAALACAHCGSAEHAQGMAAGGSAGVPGPSLHPHRRVSPGRVHCGQSFVTAVAAHMRGAHSSRKASLGRGSTSVRSIHPGSPAACGGATPQLHPAWTQLQPAHALMWVWGPPQPPGRCCVMGKIGTELPSPSPVMPSSTCIPFWKPVRRGSARSQPGGAQESSSPAGCLEWCMPAQLR